MLAVAVSRARSSGRNGDGHKFCDIDARNEAIVRNFEDFVQVNEGNNQRGPQIERQPWLEKGNS